MFRKPIAIARELHAGDPIRQIGYLFSVRTIPAAKGRPRFLGDKRFADMPKHLIQFVRMLPALRCPIQNIGELGRAHVVALGAWAYLQKPCDARRMVEAIREAATSDALGAGSPAGAPSPVR